MPEDWNFGQILLGIAIGIINHWVVYALGGIMADDRVTHEFKDAFYFSIVTWTTLGYGDMHPTQETRLIAAMEGLLGYLYIAVLLALYSLGKQNIQSMKSAENDQE